MKNKIYYYKNSLLKHDLKSSISVFFVALPLCLGIALASGAPIYSGLIAGMIGGIIVSFFSKSELSVSGPAAGLVTISASAIQDMGSMQALAISVMIAGVLQLLLGIFKLGGFTYFIPASVIKGMLAAIGILLLSKQIPLLIGYEKPNFWSSEFFNIVTFNHSFDHFSNLFTHSSGGVIIISLLSLIFLFGWERINIEYLKKWPSAFLIVILAISLALLFVYFIPYLKLAPHHFVQLPENVFGDLHWPDINILGHQSGQAALIWETAVVICLVASLETLLSITAIDKLDPFNRITPQNNELIAQGIGNVVSGSFGGLPITSVIVRSSANLEAGAKTKISSILHGLWLLAALLFAVSIINRIPYCALAAILFRTGFQLAKPGLFKDIYAQGREQFMPFIVTIISILFTDLLIGVAIGFIYSLYFLIKHQYKSGFRVDQVQWNHSKKFIFNFDQNVSFLNKRRMTEYLDAIPEYSIVEMNGSETRYFDFDILEIIQDFKSKAHRKHIELILKSIPEVKTIEVH